MKETSADTATEHGTNFHVASKIAQKTLPNFPFLYISTLTPTVTNQRSPTHTTMSSKAFCSTSFLVLCTSKLPPYLSMISSIFATSSLALP